jgi:aryl-alcohol dehydrogenase-like predicted oxidoreductase
MRLIPLGNSGLMVSEFCLGTMTFGTQTAEPEAHAQIALALDRGVTFWDTAEMYPTNPIRPETIGETEAILGRWLARAGGRDKVVLATKVSGAGMGAVRGGAPITGASLRVAIEGSLRRLQTDCVDLYQLHWPNRGSYHFRQMWDYAPKEDRDGFTTHAEDVLDTAAALIAEGKIRAIGLSNETVWGTAQWLRLAEARGLPRMASVQNEYSLLCRAFDTDFAELAVMENVPLLAFSILATGLLTGKYAGDATPPGSRRSFTPGLGGRTTPRAHAAVAAYHDLARRHGLDPVQMAIAFCEARPFPCIPILGATTVAQLDGQLGAAGLRLSAEVLGEIDAIHRDQPLPF